MTTILHLARRADWDAALASGSYRVSTRGATLDQVGFIHASYPHQLAAVAELVYADDTAELCVLVLDREALLAAGTPVRDEDGGGGTAYPHVYGPIDPAFVTDVRTAGFDAEGRFSF
ncbi:DUF952 domain-containing protein [Cellulomonas sp. P22]|uniref:DUF952 domain-containing protein n=1 Tax=Cellulomonas sp. P22 TaxID=3373189 RepID=UPI0037A8BEF9